MTTSTYDKHDRALRRAAIERIIAAYPDIDETSRNYLFDYFRRHATARDRAAIATNRAIRPQYRQLLRDHKLHWLPWIDAMVVAGMLCLLALGGLCFAFLDFGGPA